jgi:uncharacterized membrane protein SirB2
MTIINAKVQIDISSCGSTMEIPVKTRHTGRDASHPAGFVGGKVMAKKLPNATKGQGCRNALITSLLVAAVIGTLWLILYWGFKQSARQSLFLAWLILVVVIGVWAVLSWFQNKDKAGKVLLDLLPYPHKTLNLVSGILFILIGFIGAFDFGYAESQYGWVISSLIGLAIGAYQIVIGYSHIRVHEHGIMAYQTFLKWERIESFQWISGNHHMLTLKLKYKGRLPLFMREGALPVPLEKKPELEGILEKYVR